MATNGNLVIQKMIVYLKLDNNLDFWFLWCESMRKTGKETFQSVLHRHNHKAPLQFTMSNTLNEETIHKGFSQNKFSPAQLIKSNECIVCKHKFVGKDMFEIRYLDLIRHYERYCGE